MTFMFTDQGFEIRIIIIYKLQLNNANLSLNEKFIKNISMTSKALGFPNGLMSCFVQVAHGSRFFISPVQSSSHI
jgi:hypothetical protein